MCGSDPLADQKKAAANAEAQAAAQQAAIAAKNSALVDPFYQDRLQNGLPYMKDMTDYNAGTIAQSYAPMKGQLARTNAQYGTGLPSGYADQQGIDLNSQEGTAFDNNIVNALNMNEAAKQTAAYGLNPLPYYGGATGANRSVLGAQVQPGGFWNFMGGLANSAVQGAASAV